MDLNDTTKLEELVSPDYKIGETKFRVNKLKGIHGFRVFEKIRTAIGTPVAGMAGKADNEEGIGTSVMSLLANIPADKVEDLLTEMLKSTDVKIKDHQSYINAGTSRAMLDDILKPLDYYEILVRGLVVNFMESSLDLLSRHGLVDQSTVDRLHIPQ